MFGDRLRELRKERGLSQEELGKRIGTTKQTISRYESGRTPDVETIMKLAEVLDVPFGTLIQGYDWDSVTVYGDDVDKEIVQRVAGPGAQKIVMPANKAELHKLIDDLSPSQADVVLAMVRGLSTKQ